MPSRRFSRLGNRFLETNRVDPFRQIKHTFCDGSSRRHFLRVGALGGALSLADMLRFKSQTAAANSRSSVRVKSVIMVYLLGGPSQLDTWDMKPDAPAEYRGPFTPIKTNVGGIEICELFRKLATMMDKLAIIRSLPNPATTFKDSSGRPVYLLDDREPVKELL